MNQKNLQNQIVDRVLIFCVVKLNVYNRIYETNVIRLNKANRLLKEAEELISKRAPQLKLKFKTIKLDAKPTTNNVTTKNVIDVIKNIETNLKTLQERIVQFHSFTDPTGRTYKILLSLSFTCMYAKKGD